MTPRIAVALVLALLHAGVARGDDTSRRCALRLAGTLLGQSPSAALYGATDPQASVASLLTSDAFVDRFARFVNTFFNRTPGNSPAADAPYYLAKHVMTSGRAWRELFVGPYRVEESTTSSSSADVLDDANGLGYFRSPAWMKRYAGNEKDGYRLVSAYRIMQNVIGLELHSVQNTTGSTAATRMDAGCAGCHYNTTYGLDLVARVLSRRVGTGDSIAFAAPSDGPQTVLDGKLIHDDGELVHALVDAPDFAFRSCRLAFTFLYGRAEYQSEGASFDRCMVAFAASGSMQDGLASLATDPSYCQ